MTMLHAGGKFEAGAYTVSGGLHGVGVSVVNALSSKLEVDVVRDGNLWRQEFAEGKPKGKLAKVKPARRTGTTITFFGHKGGVGTTTLAVNTALMLAGSHEAGEVALADTALQFGDAAALLGLAPDRDLADMARGLDEPGALSAYLSQHPETGLRVLARPRELYDAEGLTPERWRATIETLRDCDARAGDPRTRRVDHVLKIHSLHPESLLDHLRLYKTIMHAPGALSLFERELMGVVVSGLNGCVY